jgi:class 3 adenylate cyclase/tetratricopeptide (TPR) repeat protein
VVVCPSCGQENPDGFKFCGACGSPLIAPEPPPEEERKVVTALFTDIVGSTARAEAMDPEDVRARLAAYYARVRRELETHGGSVEKFIGDAVVALFGAPVAHEDDPERAVRAALAITRAVAELNEEDAWLDLHIRTAVHTGEALVVVAGGEGEGMATGDVMNTAARLQGGAPVDGVAVGEATYRATRHLFEYEAAEPLAAKGKAEPVPVWVVTGEKAAGRPVPWRPLVGRNEEVALLAAIWNRARSESRPQLVNVVGPPGIGKSRLLVELCQRIEPDARTYWGRCLSYGEGITYWPVRDIIQGAAGIRHDDDAATLSRKLGALLEGLATGDRDELRTMAAAAANLLGAATTPEGTYQAEEIGQAELHWGVRRIVELLALQNPLLLVFEDLHWAEPTLLELLLSFLDGESPLMVIGTARPELLEMNAAFAHEEENRHLVLLEPLGNEESEALLAELVSSTDLDLDRLRILLENAGGNPLFLEETVRMLMDAELLDSGAELEALPIPDSLQALIGSRLDALPAADKRVAQQASVVGAIFWLGAVAHLAGTRSDVDGHVATLERRDFVYPRPDSTIAGDREFEFKHILIRDVAYERLPKGRRAELHVLFSEWLSGLPGLGEEVLEIHAYHLEQACRLASEVVRSPIEPPVVEAVTALRGAGDRAVRRGGMREADRYFSRALELAGDEHAELAVELRSRRARSSSALGHVNQAVDELTEVIDEAARVGRPDVRAGALVTLAALDLRRGHGEQARPRLHEAESIASQIGDRPLEIRAWFELAALQQQFDADFDQALALLEQAVRIAEEIDDRALRVEGHLRLGFVRFNAGDLGGAEDELRCCIRLASAFGTHRDEARATYLLGLAQYYRGSLDEAERLGLQARDWFERTGETYFQIQNFVALAMHALASDDPVTAERWAREATPLALEEGGWLFVEIYRYLVEALVRQGRVDEAREFVDFADRDVPEEDLYAQACIRVAEALVATADGDQAAAARAFDRGVELLQRVSMPIAVGEARIAYARSLRAFGADGATQAQLGMAKETFERVGASRLVEQLEGELAATSEAGSAGPTLPSA